jgi:hypothetical protein
MTKSKMTRALFLGAIVLGLFLAGCDTGLSPSGDGAPELKSGTGKGTVTLNVGLEGLSQTDLGAALTVKPSTLAGVTYQATFSGGPGTVDPVTLVAGKNTVELDPGTYGIRVRAYKVLGTEAAPGTAIADKSLSNVVVSKNADTNKAALLTPIPSSTLKGTFTYSITVPAGLGTGTLKITGTGVNETVDLNVADKTEFDSGEDGLELPAGIHQLSVTLTRGTGAATEYAGFSEVRHIYAGLVSALPPELSAFTNNDFSAQVGTPVELAFAAPVTGEDPVRAISAAQYDGAIVWTYEKQGTTYTVPANAKFTGELVYTAAVALTAKPGFTFTGIPGGGSDPEKDAITYADTELLTSLAYADGNGDKLALTAVFKETIAATVTKTTLSNVPGTTLPVNPVLVVRPVTGNTPVTAYTSTIDEYSVGTIEWNTGELLGGKFNGDTAYIATVPLTAKDGFTFYGLGADAFVFSGAESVENPEPTADDGKAVTVTVTFPATALSAAQNALATLGIGGEPVVATATGTDTITVTGAAVIADNKQLAAGVSLVVNGSLTVAASKTLTVAGTLTANSAGTLAVQGEGAAKGKFVTGGAGSVVVNTTAQFDTVFGAMNGNLAVTVNTGTLSITEATELKLNTKLTAGENTAITVSGALTGNGTLATTAGSAASKIILSGTAEVNGANFEWALKPANAIEKLELGAATTLPNVQQAATVTVPAKTDVTINGAYALTVPANKTLNVLGTIGGPSATLVGAGSVALANTTAVANSANLAWALKTTTVALTLGAGAPATVGTSTVAAKLTVNAALTVQNGTLTVTDGTLAGTGTLTTGTGGQVTLDANGTLNNENFAWAVANAGTALNLNVNKAVTAAAGTVVPAAVTLSGAGVLTAAGDLTVAGKATIAGLVDSKEGGATILFTGTDPVTIGAYTAKAEDDATTFGGGAKLTITALTDGTGAAKVVFNGPTEITSAFTTTGGGLTIDGSGAVELAGTVGTIATGNLTVTGTGLKTVAGAVTTAASTKIDASAGLIKFGGDTNSVTLSKAKLVSGSAGVAAVAAQGAVTLAYATGITESASLELEAGGSIAMKGTGSVGVGGSGNLVLSGDNAVFTALQQATTVGFGAAAEASPGIIGAANGAVFKVSGPGKLALATTATAAILSKVTLDLSVGGTLSVPATTGAVLTLGTGGTADVNAGILLSPALGLVGDGTEAPAASSLSADVWAKAGTGDTSGNTTFIDGVITASTNGIDIDKDTELTALNGS